MSILPSHPEFLAPGVSQARARARTRWLARVRRRWETVTQTIELGRLSISFTRIADPDRVLDEMAEAEDRRERVTGDRRVGDALHLPYWAELWDSAVALSSWLVERVDSADWAGLVSSQPGAAGPRVLDLGCGMGLSGCSAAALGANVTFADLESPPLLLAQFNCSAFAWPVRARQLNWQKDRLGERFSIILGADIVYERAQWDYLEPFFCAHLEYGGVVLLGEPHRPSGDAFIGWMEAKGWRVGQEEQPLAKSKVSTRVLMLRPPLGK